jgi:hypothetical protein
MMRKSKDEEEITQLRNTLKQAFDRFKVCRSRRDSALSLGMYSSLSGGLAHSNRKGSPDPSDNRGNRYVLAVCERLRRVFSLYFEDTLRSLKPVSSARYNARDSSNGCLKDTREDVLSSMLSWLAEPSSPSSSMSIFWLAGLAGTGKSTIMKTFCERVSSDDRFLLASFFASRNSAERRDPYSIVHTFAYQLAITTDSIRSHILSVLRAPQDVMQEPMQEQVNQLLAGPLSKAPLHGRIIVLAIDALDECQKCAGVEGGPLIKLLAQLLQDQPIKLLITSRQEDSIAKLFGSLSHVPLRLHEIKSTIVKADVRRILEAGFEDIRRDRAHDLQTDQWPTQSALDMLVDLTGPFFIYAATVLKFVGELRFLPEERLDKVLQRGSATSSDNSRLFSKIDVLYLDILKAATEDEAGDSNMELRRRVGDLLRTIVLLEEPVSVYALAHLMDSTEHVRRVDSDVRALSSVLMITHNPGSERFSDTVSTFHPSFRDFLVDPQRCSAHMFLVKPAKDQHQLLARCLRLMNRWLRHDICSIRNPGRANAGIQDLPKRLAENLPEAVRYACLCWPVHLVSGGPLAESVAVMLLEFCVHHLLHWLEVLSLLDALSSAGRYFSRIAAWCQVSFSTAIKH